MRLSGLVLKKNHFDNIAVLVAILGMGSLYFQVLRMPLMAVMLIMVATVYFIRKPRINRKDVAIFAFFTGLFLLTSLLNYKNGFYLNDIIIWLINIVFIMSLQQNMTFDTFKEKYVKIMIIEAMISLVCFVISDQLELTLPLMTVDVTETSSFYLTPYFTRGWGNIPYFHRNAGWYTEPGAHQIFLSFALLFLTADKKHCGMTNRQYIISIFILVVTIISTLSTTAFMCLAVVLISMLVKNTSEKHIRIKIVAIILLIVLLVVENQTGVIENKISGISIGSGSGRTRLNDTVYGYYIALQKPIIGHGMYMTNQRQIMNEFGINNISNGMASFSIRAGIVLTLVILAIMYRALKKRFNYGFLYQICVFGLFLLCVNSEGLFLNILFLAFWAPWQGDLPAKKLMMER